MGFSFYFNSATKNIRYGKKQAFLYCFSIFISVALIISLQLWSSTAEDLAAKDFLEDQDFEMKITTYRPEEIPLMIEWLKADPLIDSIHELYYNLACFNTEGKSESYRFLPEDNQEDMNNPISLTSLGLFPKETLERIKSQFFVRGSFDLGLNEVLISEYEATELERIYGLPIQPGMQINISIAKRSPELGEVFLFHMQLENFNNVTIKGIYRTIPKITLLQKIFSNNFLKDSVIFLKENVNEVSLIQMNANGIVPIICVKMNIVELKKDGIDQILPKLNSLADKMKITFQASQYIILETPTLELQQSYSFAKLL